jgi:hypothetical protein
VGRRMTVGVIPTPGRLCSSRSETSKTVCRGARKMSVVQRSSQLDDPECGVRYSKLSLSGCFQFCDSFNGITWSLCSASAGSVGDPSGAAPSAETGRPSGSPLGPVGPDFRPSFYATLRERAGYVLYMGTSVTPVPSPVCSVRRP